jgi:glycerol-3-phosphate dehydrogenase
MRLVLDGGMEAVTATRLEYRHGGRSLRILERMQKNPREAAVVCPCEPVTEAEIRYVVASELAVSVEDVARRTRLGLGSCGGMRCALRCGRIVADAIGASPEYATRSSLQFLHGASRKRLAALNPDQARQEALSLASLRAELGPGAESSNE